MVRVGRGAGGADLPLFFQFIGRWIAIQLDLVGKDTSFFYINIVKKGGYLRYKHFYKLQIHLQSLLNFLDFDLEFWYPFHSSYSFYRVVMCKLIRLIQVDKLG